MGAADDNQNPVLRRWRVMAVVSRTGSRSRHVYGHDITSDTGVVSSAIGEYHLETMTATTRSGKKYKLAGVPGHSRVGDYVWQKWRAINGVLSEVDVSDEYFTIDTVFGRAPGDGAEG